MTASSPSPTIVLTTQQVAFYHREGYLALGPLTTPEEIARLRIAYDHHFANCSGRAEGRQFDLFGDDTDPDAPNVPQILGLSQDVPEITASLLWANARSVLAQLFGQEPDYIGDHAILKPPRCPKPTPWHQDEAYWSAGHDTFAASVWVPLQDVDQSNGCMHFVPRSHWGEILPHRSENDDPRVHGLELDFDATEMVRNAVACPLPAGGCTIHHQRTLHYATANPSPHPRRAWIIGGGLTPRALHVPRAHTWNEEKRTLRTEREKAHKQAAATAPAA
ncbi:MAG TPA: phytanoyl-CoA dioxygenase family protein [Planctomycetota bacterium]|nr:phytanoyl-CoA dioxygenase family protein [Planctomycetota bacterium]